MGSAKAKNLNSRKKGGYDKKCHILRIMKNKIKIVNLIENLDETYGGPSKSLPYMCKSLENICVKTEILSIKLMENEYNGLIEKYNLKWNSFKPNLWKKIKYSRNLKRYLEMKLKKNDYSIINTHNLWNYILYVAYKISKKYNVPLIVTIRGSAEVNSIQKKIAWHIFQKKVFMECSLIHVTKFEDIKFLRGLGIKTPISLVPNGINLEEFKCEKEKNDFKKSLNLNLEKKYIIFLSRIHPQKGLDYLVNSWIELAKQFQNYDLLIIGPEYDKCYVENIKISIKNANLENRVFFMGMISGSKRLSYLRASDLFVLPSYSENFGIAIAEAMASKLPVITTHGTPWKRIEEENAGWWVELSQQNIKISLEEALNATEDDLKKKGENGYNIIKNYDWKYQAEKIKKTYEWVLFEKNKPDFIYEYKKDNKSK